MTTESLISPYGGKLVNLIVDDARAAEMKAVAQDHASLTLDERGLCDLELLAVGGYSPLTGFLDKADHDRVVAESRLADGTFWPLPITLPIPPDVEVGKPLALRDVYGNLLAFLHVAEIYPSEDRSEHYAAGKLEVLRIPPHHDFVDLRRTPLELREHFTRLGWTRVAAFHTRDIIHLADEAMIRRAAEQIGAGLLLHPDVGVPTPGDVDHYTRVRCYRALVDDDEPGSVVLGLLPLAPRNAGPREALLHAIIARNYGCSDLITRPDHVSREAMDMQRSEVGIGLIDAIPAESQTATLTNAQVRDDYLARGLPLPDWFTRPAIAAILNEANPPRFRQGLTIWFTGLSGSGKSTVAHALVERLAEFGRNVSFLDGDEIRTHLSKGLTFSKEDRDANINRVGYVAGLVARHGGTTLCSVISPYRAPRDNARKASHGNFVEVYCATPIETCESRDVKGLYARARTALAEGKGLGFTGIDDPYEPPLNPEVTIDTSRLTVAQATDAIVAKLIELGYILPHGHIGE